MANSLELARFLLPVPQANDGLFPALHPTTGIRQRRRRSPIPSRNRERSPARSLVCWVYAMASHAKQRLVVVGNGMAPGRALRRLSATAPEAYDATIFNAEPRVNYDRIMLSPVLSGDKSFEEIVIHG